MATRLYFHDAASQVSGTLPNDEQSTLTPSAAGVPGVNPIIIFTPVTDNKSMNTTIGTSQVALSKNDTWNTAGNPRVIYVTRYVSELLGVTSINANTWTYNFATLESNLNANWPVSGSDQTVYVNLYVWRPSGGGSKVGTILDGNTAATVDEHTSTNVERCHVTTFSGSAVTCQTGDVLILEVWFHNVSGQTIQINKAYYYDGTTANTTNNATVSNHASFIETPQDISFQAPGPIEMTQSSAKVLTNKFITKV